jgi:hypothetical protein
MRRIDPNAIRQAIYRAFLLRLAPYAVAIPVVAVVLAALSVLISVPLSLGLAGTGALATAADVARRWGRFAGDDVAASAPTLVANPGYEGRLGFLHLVDEDLRRIMGLAASSERPLVVFIDDLDRCSYTTVSQVIEALNAFLAGDFEDCIFVIAMEPDLVAAQIHVAYEKLFDRMAEREGSESQGDLGWRFLEKMVQLPLALPPPEEHQLRRFVDSVVGAETQRQAGELDDSDPELQRARALIREERRGSSLEGIGDALQRVQEQAPGEPEPRRQAVLQKAARLEYAHEFNDSHPEVRQMLHRYADDLDRNPREIKRFINVFRFYAYVQFWRHTAGLPGPDLEGVGKLATLAVRAPHLLSVFGRPSRCNGETGVLLHWLEQGAGDEQLWSKRVALAPAHVRDELVNSAALRALIGRVPMVGESATGFL